MKYIKWAAVAAAVFLVFTAAAEVGSQYGTLAGNSWGGKPDKKPGERSVTDGNTWRSITLAGQGWGSGNRP